MPNRLSSSEPFAHSGVPLHFRGRPRHVVSREVRGLSLRAQFRILWCSTIATSIGDGVTYAALSLLAVSLTRDARLVASVEAATHLGWLLLALYSGVVIDRSDRFKVMFHAEWLRGILLGVLAVCVLTGTTSIALVIALAFALGLIGPFYENASAAVVPEVADEDALESANGRIQGSRVLGTNLLGPPLGTAAFAVAAFLPFGLDAVSFLLSAAFLGAVWRSRARLDGPARSPRGRGGGIRAAARVVLGDRTLLCLALGLAVLNFVTSGVTSVLALYALDQLSLGAAGFGWLFTAFAVGGLLAAAVVSRLAATIGRRPTAVLGAAAFGATAVTLGLTDVTAVAVVAIAWGGAGIMLWSTVTMAYRQLSVDRLILGRVVSVSRLVGYGLMPVGAVVSGLLAHSLGVAHTYLILGALLLATAVVLWRPLAAMDMIEAAPSVTIDG